MTGVYKNIIHCSLFQKGVSVEFTDQVFNVTENESALVCIMLSGSTLARNVTVNLHISSTEGEYCMLLKMILTIFIT